MIVDWCNFEKYFSLTEGPLMKKILVFVFAFLSLPTLANEIWSATVCEQGESIQAATTKLNGSTKRGVLHTISYTNSTTGRIENAQIVVREVSAPSVAVVPKSSSNENGLLYTVCATIYR